MSKKIYSTSAWSNRLSRIGRKRDKRRDRKSSRGSPSKGRRRPFEWKCVVAPTRFSLRDNPDEVVCFLNRIDREINNFRLNNFGLTIDFEQVVEITPEALLALTATIKKHSERRVRGTIPKDPKACEIFKGSGFFEHFSHKLSLQASSQGHGLMAEFSGDRVDPVRARQLIMHGTARLTGQPLDVDPAYSVILEAMQNTLDHAHHQASKGLFSGDIFKPKVRNDALKPETWWAMVYSDISRRRICFALLDTGVGIFKSARVKGWKRVDRVLRKTDDTTILQQMLQGQIASRTGLNYRGKGLPTMYRYSQSGDICDLLIMSNSVHAEIGQNEFKVIKEQFRGTMLYWEIAK